jgi:hypothetical protein
MEDDGFEVVTAESARADAYDTVAQWVDATMLRPTGLSLATASPETVRVAIKASASRHRPSSSSRCRRFAAAAWTARRPIAFATNAAIVVARIALLPVPTAAPFRLLF